MNLCGLIRSESQKLEWLAKLEMEIYRCGIDGGQMTSVAIEELESAEKYWGVYDPKIPAPRWICNG